MCLTKLGVEMASVILICMSLLTCFVLERFSNLLLSLSGIAASATGALECYQMLRLFKIVSFEQTAEQLVFDAVSDSVE